MLTAQDVHWSQAANAPLYYNPAFTGITGKYSLSANYRDQWNSVSSTYRTAMLAGDLRTGKEEKDALKFNAGAIFINDLAAAGNFRNNVFGASVSTFVKLDNRTFIGGGLSVCMQQYTIFSDNFLWSSQYNGKTLDPSLPTGESTRTGIKSFADAGTGISMLYDETAGAADKSFVRKWIAGYSLQHINRPDKGMFGMSDRLKMKHTLYITGFLPMRDNRAFKPTVIVSRQGQQMEMLAGGLLRYSIGDISIITGIRKGAGFAVGVLYRYNDAVIPVIEYEKGNILFGFSYDINVSRFSAASKYRGGAEISIRLKPGADFLYKEKPKAPSTRSMER
jgi:type IX secretion system PorP/SprF family membrane protein